MDILFASITWRKNVPQNMSDDQKERTFFWRYIKQSDQGNLEEHIVMRNIISNFVQTEILESPVEEEKVWQTVKSAKKGAPSPEGCLKEADNKVIKQMTEDYNQSLNTGVKPEEWLLSYLIPLPKIY